MGSRRYQRKSISSGRQRIARSRDVKTPLKNNVASKDDTLCSNSLIKLDENGDIVNKISSEYRRDIEKLINDRPFNGLYNIALGLPSRVRSYIKKIWKRQNRESNWDDIMDDMASIAAKILDHRIDVVAFVGPASIKAKDLASENRIKNITSSIEETDALLTIYSSYFLCGITVDLSGKCCALADGGNRAFIVGGLVDIINFGLYTSHKRHIRKINAHKIIKDNGWKLPKRVEPNK